MSASGPSKSPTLLPPRKSVELEDAGARDLESSADEEDVFSDARDELMSPTSPSVPITRVEKVDDSAAHGQVPGTEAYEKRTQDAVPDEVAIVPDGTPSMPTSRRASVATPTSPDATSIPRTVIEKVDASSPSHGEVPGTTAHDLRRADAVPDAIVTGDAPQGTTVDTAIRPVASPMSPSSAGGIPRTVVTRVDSKPSHGEVPGTDAYQKRSLDAEPDILEKKEDVPKKGSSQEEASPIAADGGFGPMNYDDDEEEEEEEDGEGEEAGEEDEESEGEEQSEVTITKSTAVTRSDDANDVNEVRVDGDDEDDEDGFGDDFDDFEEGAGADDFGEFDEGLDEKEEEQEEQTTHQPPPPTYSIPSFTVPDLSSPESLKEFLSAEEAHLSAIFPIPGDRPPTPPASLSEASSTFLTERSLSLWSQLVAPPPLQPPNWVRSRIRRLFLVSLGVPVDLDEILPASKQKKLILPYTASTSPSADGSGAPRTAASRLRNSADGNANASDSAASASGPRGSGAGGKGGRRRKGPMPPPEFDVAAVRVLCATTEEALARMSDAELKAHVAKLKELVARGEDVLKYWVKRKEATVGEKEAFDGVIENLVRHARRVRE